MKLQSVQLHNFKSFSDGLVSFEDGLTVLVGDNGSGKSSVGQALQSAIETHRVVPVNVRYGMPDSTINATFMLNPDEIDSWIINPIAQQLTGQAIDYAHQVRAWLTSMGNLVTVTVDQGGGGELTRFGPITFNDQHFQYLSLGVPTRNVNFSRIIEQPNWIETIENSGPEQRYALNTPVGAIVTGQINELITLIPDFRSRFSQELGQVIYKLWMDQWSLAPSSILKITENKMKKTDTAVLPQHSMTFSLNFESVQ